MCAHDPEDGAGWLELCILQLRAGEKRGMMKL